MSKLVLVHPRADWLAERLAPSLACTVFHYALMDQARDALGDADILVALSSQIDEDALERAANLKWIHLLTTGYDSVARSSHVPKGTIVTNSREIAAADFFQGMFTTALEEGEIITAIRFPIPAKSAYAKFLQPASRFALTGAFVAQYADGVRVAITGASEGGVFRWSEAEAALSGDFSPEALSGLSVPAGGMIGDLHGTPGYRAHLVGVMTRRAVAAAS